MGQKIHSKLGPHPEVHYSHALKTLQGHQSTCVLFLTRKCIDLVGLYVDNPVIFDAMNNINMTHRVQKFYGM